MTDGPTPSRGGLDSAGERVVCPVCGTEGDERGLRNHLVYEHGWDDEEVPAGPTKSTAESATRGPNPGTTD